MRQDWSTWLTVWCPVPSQWLARGSCSIATGWRTGIRQEEKGGEEGSISRAGWLEREGIPASHLESSV